MHASGQLLYYTYSKIAFWRTLLHKYRMNRRAQRNDCG
jgi:hypothetical protein